MEMKTKVLDKKHLFIIVIAILSIIISYFNMTYAYFSDTKNQPISIKSVNTFGQSTVYEPNIFIEGNLSSTTKIKNNQTLSFAKDNVDTHDYLLTVATQVEPHTTEYEENEYKSISYEIYHKTQEDLDTSSFTCSEGKYNNGTSEDTCNTGTFIENSLNGLPFELIKDFRITDTNTHYFDVYIYLNNDTTSKKLKTRIFYLDKEVEKEKVKYNPNPPEIDSTGLVPIKYNETSGKWKVTTQDDPEWYDYDNQKWANAASVKSGVITESNPYPELTVPDGTSTNSDILAMFVWIPRYSYTIGCTDIDGVNGINKEITTDTVPTECLGYKVPEASPLTLATPGAIDIKFVDKNTTENYTGDSPTYTYTSEADRNPTNYYTHPAFNFGNDKLTGIWVGKFETSTDVNASCYNSETSNCVVGATEVRILPNVTSMRYQKVANQFAYSQYFSAKDNIYGLTGDAHMMKNSEWAAVAYLSQSIYGKYGNKAYSGGNKEIYINNYYKTPTDGYITGVSAGAPSTSTSRAITCRYNEEGDNRTEGTGLCGPGASSTGNIYGIYDMSGGAREYVMGNYGRISNGVFTGTVASSGIDFSKIDNKYYDKFTIDTPFTTKNTETIGQALYEVANWYGDDTDTLSSTYAWLSRGAFFTGSSNAGAFNGFAHYGNPIYSNGVRSVFVMTST